MQGVRAVFHAATLHKPHVATHRRQDFIDTNVTGTLNLLEEAVAAGVESFVYTSTTSVFGDALVPPPGAAAVWVTEDVMPVPKNIYGVTKVAAEDLCQLFHRNQALACVVLRTSRFFPEQDDNRDVREAYPDDNVKMNEYLHRRVAIEDVVTAHLLASERAPALGFRKYIVSATTPFRPDDLLALRVDAPRVVRQRVPDYEAEYERRGWKMFPSIGRVYVNDRAQRELGWQPRYDFRYVIERLRALERADKTMKERVRATLEQVYNQQSEDFVSIPRQIDGIKAQLVENAKKRIRTSEADPLFAMLEVEAKELLERQGELEAKKDKLGLVDSPEEIEKLHRLLGNFEALWPTFDLDQRQRSFRLLINRIAIESFSPHWMHRA